MNPQDLLQSIIAAATRLTGLMGNDLTLDQLHQLKKIDTQLDDLLEEFEHPIK